MEVVCFGGSRVVIRVVVRCVVKIFIMSDSGKKKRNWGASREGVQKEGTEFCVSVSDGTDE